MIKIPQFGFNDAGGISSVAYVDLPAGGSSAAWGAITGDISSQDDLQQAFSIYSVTSHNHNSLYAAIGHGHTTYQAAETLSSAAFTVSSMYSVSSHTHPGGSDPWTYLKQASHFGLSTVNWTDIPGLSITPAAGSTYEFEGCLMLMTSTAAINPQTGFRWPTGTTSVGWINQSQSATGQIMGFGNQISTVRLVAGGLPTTTGPWPCIYGGVINAFGAAGSSFAIQLRTESSGVFVSSLAGSFLKYRAY